MKKALHCSRLVGHRVVQCIRGPFLINQRVKVGGVFNTVFLKEPRKVISEAGIEVIQLLLIGDIGSQLKQPFLILAPIV